MDLKLFSLEQRISEDEATSTTTAAIVEATTRPPKPQHPPPQRPQRGDGELQERQRVLESRLDALESVFFAHKGFNIQIGMGGF